MKTKAEQRIELAKDVLKWIGTEKLDVKAVRGYFEPFPKRSDSRFVGKQLKDVLPKMEKCEVCGIGGMFYAHIMRYNNYEIGYIGVRFCVSSFNIHDTLKMFSSRTLNIIERSFEGQNQYRTKHKIVTDEGALTHIMNNIIKNKGTFKP